MPGVAHIEGLVSWGQEDLGEVAPGCPRNRCYRDPQYVFMVTTSPTTQRAVLPDMSAAALLLVSSLLEHLLTR